VGKAAGATQLSAQVNENYHETKIIFGIVRRNYFSETFFAYFVFYKTIFFL